MATSTIHFLDVDGTICDGGSDELYPGVAEQVADLRARPGNQVWLFTCRPPGLQAWQEAVRRQGLTWDGFLHKPLADSYTWWDDKIAETGHCLCHPKSWGHHGHWFSREEVAAVLGEEALQKLREARNA